MATDTSQPTKAPLSDADKKARTILAKALWRAETNEEFADNATRNAAFAEVRKPYTVKAGKLIKTIGKRGLVLSIADNA